VSPNLQLPSTWPPALLWKAEKSFLIDTDPQTNTTRVFIHPDIEIELEKSLYNSIIKLAPLSNIVMKTRVANLDIVPSHIRLSSADYICMFL
jgi:chromosome partitioning protein